MEMNLDQLMQATHGRLLGGSAACRITGVVTDTRTACAGKLFVPLLGTRADGHDYIRAAFAAGACASFIRKGHSAMGALMESAGAAALIQVDDPLRALGDLAAFWRRQFDVRVVAITGSNGKTSTKEMTVAITGRRFSTLKNPGNFNNLIGLPLSLFELGPQHQVAVLELGMSEIGEIARLAEICDPDVGIITNVGPAHLLQLKTLDQIAAAKGELFAYLGPQDTAIVNADDAWAVALGRTTRARLLRYGINDGQVRAVRMHAPDTGGMQFVLQTGDAAVPVRLRVPGQQFVMNALAAAAIALSLGMGLEDIQAGLETFAGVPGRMEIVRISGCTVINDSYNANPVSTKAALAVLAGCTAGGRRIAVLGDMLELGNASAAFHRDVGEMAARLGVDHLFVTGEFAGCVSDGAAAAGMNRADITVCDTVASLAGRLRNMLCRDDVILLKGSRGMKMEQVLELLRQGPPHMT